MLAVCENDVFFFETQWQELCLSIKIGKRVYIQEL